MWKLFVGMDSQTFLNSIFLPVLHPHVKLTKWSCLDARLTGNAKCTQKPCLIKHLQVSKHQAKTGNFPLQHNSESFFDNYLRLPLSQTPLSTHRHCFPPDLLALFDELGLKAALTVMRRKNTFCSRLVTSVQSQCKRSCIGESTVSTSGAKFLTHLTPRVPKPAFLSWNTLRVGKWNAGYIHCIHQNKFLWFESGFFRNTPIWIIPETSFAERIMWATFGWKAELITTTLPFSTLHHQSQMMERSCTNWFAWTPKGFSEPYPHDRWTRGKTSSFFCNLAWSLWKQARWHIAFLQFCFPCLTSLDWKQHSP